jgi:hypothetical protein
MKRKERARIMLSETGGGSPPRQLELFALLNLGIVESLAGGALTATEAVEHFYHSDNCLFVRKHLRNREADRIMSHGVQLPDLFVGLPPEEAQREFYHELERIRTLSLKLLEKVRSADVPDRATA